MSKYRTHTCGELTKTNNGSEVTLSGWVNKKRDHGNLLFIDLRDNFGITQCIIDKENKFFNNLEKVQLETVIKIDGTVAERSLDTINNEIKTGEIEVKILSYEVLGTCKELPMPVFSDQEYAEDIRLKYRFLDLRRKKIHENIILRSKVISFIRDEMLKLGFLEFQTPILTSSSGWLRFASLISAAIISPIGIIRIKLPRVRLHIHNCHFKAENCTALKFCLR